MCSCWRILYMCETTATMDVQLVLINIYTTFYCWLTRYPWLKILRRLHLKKSYPCERMCSFVFMLHDASSYVTWSLWFADCLMTSWLYVVAVFYCGFTFIFFHYSYHYHISLEICICIIINIVILLSFRFLQLLVMNIIHHEECCNSNHCKSLPLSAS